MELQGKVIAVLPERSGVSARGEWKAQSFVIETHEQYPKKLCFDVFGADRLAQFNIQSGEELLVSFDIDAHEYQAVGSTASVPGTSSVLTLTPLLVLWAECSQVRFLQ